MKNSEAEQRRSDQNRDAWYGMVHVQDQSYLHQRSAKHYFNGKEEDIVVPVPALEEEDGNISAGRGLLKKALLIVFGAVLIAFVVSMLIYINRIHPGLLDFKPSNSYKIF